MSLEYVLSIELTRDLVCDLLGAPYGTCKLRQTNRAISRIVGAPMKKFGNANALLLYAVVAREYNLALYALDNFRYIKINEIACMAFHCRSFDIALAISTRIPFVYEALAREALLAGAYDQVIAMIDRPVGEVLINWASLCSDVIKERAPAVMHAVAGRLGYCDRLHYRIAEAVETGWPEGADIILSFKRGRVRVSVLEDMVAWKGSYPKAEAWAAAKLRQQHL
jgi:hypothetical protein